MANRFWLFKSEPEVFSIDDLEKADEQITHWDGVRNYQARNYLRDEIKPGDQVLFYHSNCEPPSVVGICEVVRRGYPDFTAFDPNDPHYDPKSKENEPTWFMVDIQLKKKFKQPLSLEEIRQNPKLATMKLVQRGNRLSVMEVTREEWNEIVKGRK